MFLVACTAVTLTVCVGAQAGDGVAAQWDFDADHGEKVSDTSGNGIDGIAYGAKWAECGEGYALLFDEPGAHVNCGDAAPLDIRGAITLEAWVYPTQRAEGETGIAGKSFDSYALTIYGDGYYYWYVSSGGNKCRAEAKVRRWSHLVGTFDGETMKLYVNGELSDSCASQFIEVKRGDDFLIGRIVRYAADGTPTESFVGYIDAVRVYDRVLSPEEVGKRYAETKATHRRMEKGLDRIVLTPYCYFEDGTIFTDVDFGALAPFAENERGRVTLRRKGAEESLQEVSIAEVPESGVVRDVQLDFRDVAPGDYTISAQVVSEEGVREETKSEFAYPPRLVVPSPRQAVVPPLPPAPGPVDYEVAAGEGGGFRISLLGEGYVVESFYSYPHGGQNGLTVSACTEGEAAWHVAVEKPDATTYRVRAGGAFYAIDRQILLRPGHVLVKDTFTNRTDEPLGIILVNQVDAHDKQGLSSPQFPNPTVFLSRKGHGVGIVALDDVYLEQYERFFKNGVGGLRSRKFALDAGASYTLEWAVYVNGTGDYYDFINAVRKDEGLIRTVEGGFAFIERGKVPSSDFVELRALKYLSVPCLSYVTDDPGISVEGIEFTEYPAECALLKKTFAETRKRHPDLKVMFHIAHSLYATDKPDELFPDSRTLNAAGNQTDYGGNNVTYYKRYFSEAHVDEGYRWFIFYPAKDNSFGKAMLDATDFMLDQIGVTGMFADGLTHGYGGRFTYDRWDGHTAEIDPETKTITRKYASVNLLADPVLIEVIRRIEARGGVVIANSYPGTRTLHKENVLYCLETASGDRNCARLYLAPTVIGLGNPGPVQCERDVYDDIRGKLEWGGLYFYYGEKGLTHQTVTAQMYPITVEEIHRGTIVGRVRIVTTRAGVYGWPGRRDLHLAYRYDGRGVPVAHDFVTTVDREGVRTELALEKNETAVLKKIPAVIDADGPVNLVAQQYDAQGVRFTLNGTGTLGLSIREGEFPIEPGMHFLVTVGDRESTVTADGRTVTLSVHLDGPTQFALRRVAAPPP